MTTEPITLKRVIILAILTVTLPIILVTTISGTIISLDINQHETISKLQAQLDSQNKTITNLSNFIINDQMPLNCKILHVNGTLQDCFAVMTGQK